MLRDEVGGPIFLSGAIRACGDKSLWGSYHNWEVDVKGLNIKGSLHEILAAS